MKENDEDNSKDVGLFFEASGVLDDNDPLKILDDGKGKKKQFKEMNNMEDNADANKLVGEELPNDFRIKIKAEKNTKNICGTITLTIIYFMNILIKTNLVQMAYNMKLLGLIWGPITILIIATMSISSLNLILDVQEATGIKNYFAFTELLVGHSISVIFLFLQFVGSFGGSLSFVVIFNKVIPTLLNFSLSNREFSNELIFSIVFGTIIFFYCVIDDRNKTAKSASKNAAFATICFIIISILDFVLALFSKNRLINLNKKWNEDKKEQILYGLNHSISSFMEQLNNIIIAVSCIILSFSFHGFTFTLYGSFGDISRERFYITSIVSVFLTAGIYIICGVIGYLLYYDNLNDSILDVINDNWLSSLLSLANAINVMMSCPLSFNGAINFFSLFLGVLLAVCRDLFTKILSKCSKKIEKYRKEVSKKRISKVFKDSEKKKLIFVDDIYIVKLPNSVKSIIAFIMLIIIIYVASIYNELKIIFSFLGGFMSNIVSFIFPSFFYLCLVKKKTNTKKVIAVTFIILGLITMFICLGSTYQSIFK